MASNFGPWPIISGHGVFVVLDLVDELHLGPSCHLLHGTVSDELHLCRPPSLVGKCFVHFWTCVVFYCTFVSRCAYMWLLSFSVSLNNARLDASNPFTSGLFTHHPRLQHMLAAD